MNITRRSLFGMLGGAGVVAASPTLANTEGLPPKPGVKPTLTPQHGDIILAENGEREVARLDSNGNLFLKGRLYENLNH